MFLGPRIQLGLGYDRACITDELERQSREAINLDERFKMSVNGSHTRYLLSFSYMS